MVEVGVGYNTDLKKTQSLLLTSLSTTPDLIPFNSHGSAQAPTAPEVFVMGFGDSAINFSCRCWLPADNWFQRTSNLRIQIKEALDEAGVEIPFPQRVVTVKKASDGL
jgi:small conductance mechanosensitive channel